MTRVAFGLIVLLVASTASAQDSDTAGEAPQEQPQQQQGGIGERVVDDRQAQLQADQQQAEAVDHDPEQVGRSQAEGEAPPPEEESLSHESQVGIRIGLNQPYVFAIKYGEGPSCGDPGETFCRHFGATMLDLDLGFGLGEALEMSFGAWIGLNDDDAALEPPLAFSFGVRSFGSPSSVVKLYIGGRLIVDVTSSDEPEWRSVDIGGRGELGLMIDAARYLGFYLQLGETIRFLRGFYFVTDLAVGVQARVP